MGTLEIYGQITGPTTSTPLISHVVTQSGQCDAKTLVVAATSGTQTIPVPTTATGCFINPSSGNIVQLTLKGSSGDTGIPLSLTQPSMLTFNTTTPDLPTNIYITVAAATTIEIEWF